MDFATALENINWPSILIAGVSIFVVGGLWYGPLFGQAWMKEFGFSEEDLKKRKLAKTFGLSLLLSLFAALVLDLFIGPASNLAAGASAGFLVGFGWVATFLGTLYLFEMQSLKAYLINAGYGIASFTLMGVILGAW